MSYDETKFDVERSQRAIETLEQDIDAFVDRVHLATLSQRVSASAMRLAGVPFGVKDVIDVRGLPTRYGSDAFEGAAPAREDQPVVGALRQAGAVPIGKTRSTEFAFLDATTSRNPFDLRRSPGGSSSGSGAAVGAAMVPFALGTQTAGSLCRPAAYCGAWAYKPGLGVLPQEGMAPLAPSFDSIGVIAKSAAWLEHVFRVLSSTFAVPGTTTPSGRSALRIGIVRTPEQTPKPSMSAMLARVGANLRTNGNEVIDIASPVSFRSLIDHHRVIMLFEMARHLIPFVGGKRSALRPLLSGAINNGARIDRAERDRSAAWIEKRRVEFWAEMGQFDLLVALPVPDVAPMGFESTGDQSYLTPWTALGGPLVSLPTGQDHEGMPQGVLLAAAPGQDRNLVEMALPLSALFPALIK